MLCCKVLLTECQVVAEVGNCEVSLCAGGYKPWKALVGLPELMTSCYN